MAAAVEPHSSLYDTIVVGAGIQGSFTAYHLAKRGGETLLLDQFPLPHSRGSSHGQSRIIRRAYPQEHYAQMMAESYRLWEQLEAEAGASLYRQTGLLVLGANANPEFQRCCRTLVKHNVPGELFTTESLHRRFPGIQPYHGEVGVSDHTAGVLSADRALRAVQTLRINVCYWKEKVPGAYGVSANFPCFLALCAPHHIYGLPSNEYPGLVKICYHSGSPADPEERDRPPEASALPDIQILQDFVSKYLPGLVPEPAVVEHCMYTNTPDEDFVLDRHPKFSNIIIGAGFSGHGFKLAPVVGKLLCQLSVGEEPSYAMEPFRIHRFPGLPAPAL
ncbi:peroxisomal sarcosine oxidase isoform X3 [Mauremys mutica]|uniref:peroxisomal sarcosine oxidase isoform X3 n=1 Tax=Mauremys mutica TaxID=74926 RepID=UPI001D164709|nr:peroxisomal sarcosine oxidase isoform X3 [Mauremys mutica]